MTQSNPLKHPIHDDILSIRKIEALRASGAIVHDGDVPSIRLKLGNLGFYNLDIVEKALYEIHEQVHLNLELTSCQRLILNQLNESGIMTGFHNYFKENDL